MAHEWKKDQSYGNRWRICGICGAQQEWAGEWYAPVGRCDPSVTLAEHIFKFMNEYYMGHSTTIRLYNHFRGSSRDEVDDAIDELVQDSKLVYGKRFQSASGELEGRDVMVVRNG